MAQIKVTKTKKVKINKYSCKIIIDNESYEGEALIIHNQVIFTNYDEFHDKINDNEYNIISNIVMVWYLNDYAHYLNTQQVSICSLIDMKYFSMCEDGIILNLVGIENKVQLIGYYTGIVTKYNIETMVIKFTKDKVILGYGSDNPIELDSANKIVDIYDGYSRGITIVI